MELPTLAGTKLTVSIIEGVVRVGDAKLLSTDLLADNGVVHEIDTVLVPPAETSLLEILPELNLGADDGSSGAASLLASTLAAAACLFVALAVA